MIVVHNPSNAPIKDYPIQDSKGGEVLLWSIFPGETLEFPDYVGNYLLQVYAFLQKVMTEEQYREEQKEKEKIEKGQIFTQVKIVKNEGVKSEESKREEGFTNENMQPHYAPVADKDPELVPAKAPEEVKKADGTFTCPQEGCGKSFERENHLKVHYSLKHTVVPGL